jgi:hypothetical protein
MLLGVVMGQHRGLSLGHPGVLPLEGASLHENGTGRSSVSAGGED